MPIIKTERPAGRSDEPRARRNLVVVVGNPRPQSRTLAVAEMVAARVGDALGAARVATVDLCRYADLMFRWPDDQLAVISRGVAAADILVVASPTYKGAYTGLLKGFLDRYPFNALAGVTAIPVMTGSDPVHGLAPDYTLRPLLVELGASVPTKGLFFQIAQMGIAAAVVDRWAAVSLPQLSAALPSSAPPARLPRMVGRADGARFRLSACPAGAVG